eukprot:TRINITY_DN13073_c0_g1_i1.p1 TRINITY_DN13073_c0_g1~~TRINITY_DN13073_c0_g1_i1.p1  ORF type:complete len:442 (-),score=128.86 TRINITY_DN13073_c0_g1_i1:36-1361(-)
MEQQQTHGNVQNRTGSQDKGDEQVEEMYELKNIEFFNRPVMIILQNVNGPCPLIAIANVLLLRGKLTINTDCSHITLQGLVTLIGEQIMEANSGLRESSTLSKDYEKNVSDAMSLIPNMKYGLDVNVRYQHPKDFEYTPECVIFDLLDIDLLHGWLPDPAAPEASTIMKYSYNQLVEKLVALSLITSPDASPAAEPKADASSNPSASTEPIASQTPRLQKSPESVRSAIKKSTLRREDIKKEDETLLLKEGLEAEKFLEETAGQFTKTGLENLKLILQENQLAVLFRNNHFAAIIKHNDTLFVLLTDSGYLLEPIIWERLDGVGDSVFCDGQFNVYLAPTLLSQTVSTITSAIPSLGFGDDVEIPLSDADIQEQLKIEQQIAEERDRDLAIKLHKEEVRISKEEDEIQKAIQRQEKLETAKLAKEKKAPQKKDKDSSCTVQ